jgi:uncharacterized protein
MTAVVAVIAKAPVATEVKTRLCPPLRPGEAARVAAGMLRDVLDNCAGPERTLVCVYAGCLDTLRSCVGAGTAVLPQGPGGLASRLQRAQRTLFAQRFERVLLMSGDSPTVEPDLIDAALSELATADVVIGPASDGGYTLLGTRTPTPQLFEGVAMSTSAVYEQTVGQARRHGLHVASLPVRHDIDTIDDYEAALACGELRWAPRTLAAFDAALAASERQDTAPN